MYCIVKVIGDTFPQLCSSATRVSTNDQDTTAQASGLKAAGCERIFREKANGGRWNRPELQRLLDHLRKGDGLVVWKLARLSRSLRDVLTIMERIQEAKAGFRSLTEAIDTTTPAGRMIMQMVGSFAEFERAMLREQTRAGLESALGEGQVVVGVQSCCLSNRLKCSRWSNRATRQRQMQLDSSMSIPQRFVGCLHAKAGMLLPVRGRHLYGAA
jgi:hypothetical protein